MNVPGSTFSDAHSPISDFRSFFPSFAFLCVLFILCSSVVQCLWFSMRVLALSEDGQIGYVPDASVPFRAFREGRMP